jgi:hypothetical protein
MKAAIGDLHISEMRVYVTAATLCIVLDGLRCGGHSVFQSCVRLHCFEPVLLARAADKRPAGASVDRAALGLSQRNADFSRSKGGDGRDWCDDDGDGDADGLPFVGFTSICFKFTSLPLPNSPAAAPPLSITKEAAGGDSTASVDFKPVAAGATEGFEDAEGEDLAGADFPEVEEDDEDDDGNLGDVWG